MHFKNLKDLGVSVKLGVFLGAVTLITIISFGGVIYFTTIQKDDAAVVDAAGRNRMLSQRIAFLCERILKGQPVQQELNTAVVLLNTSLTALRDGGVAPGIAENRTLPPTDKSLLPALQTAEKEWLEFKARVDVILRSQVAGKDAAAGSKDLEALTYIESNSADLLATFNNLVKLYVTNADAKQRSLEVFLTTLLLLTIAIVTLAFYVVNRFITAPVNMIRKSSALLAQGDLSYEIKYNARDEIGLAAMNMQRMADNLETAATFAEKIGQGVFDHELQAAGENDRLSKALISMRDKLVQVSREDKNRNWSAQGLALFSDITRNNQDDIQKYYDEVVSKLVNYLGANQGAIFVVNEEDNSQYLELAAMYAWNKKRFLEKRIEPGQGITGQAWLEKELVHMKQLPDNYIRITSGLGEATPKSLLVVPLKLESDVLGILELASFLEFEPYQIEFIIKLAESIAATISVLRTGERTRKLLEQSQQQAEELRAQEEEMRQNMEEMQATQEEIARKEREYIGRIRELELAANRYQN